MLQTPVSKSKITKKNPHFEETCFKYRSTSKYTLEMLQVVANNGSLTTHRTFLGDTKNWWTNKVVKMFCSLCMCSLKLQCNAASRSVWGQNKIERVENDSSKYYTYSILVSDTNNLYTYMPCYVLSVATESTWAWCQKSNMNLYKLYWNKNTWTATLQKHCGQFKLNSLPNWKLWQIYPSACSASIIYLNCLPKVHTSYYKLEPYQ